MPKKQVNKKLVREVRGRLRELRGDLTLERFAARSGLPATTVREWLASGGKILPSAEGLMGVADGFGVTVDWILFGREPKHANQHRTDAELARDLAEHLVREGTIQARAAEPALRQMLLDLRLVDGKAILAKLVESAAEDIRANLDSFRAKQQVARAYIRLTDAETAGAPVDAKGIKGIKRILDQLIDQPHPEGEVIVWGRRG